MSREEDTQNCTTCGAGKPLYGNTCPLCGNVLQLGDNAVAMPPYSDTTNSESEKVSSLFPSLSDPVSNISSKETRLVPPNDYHEPDSGDSRSFPPDLKTFTSQPFTPLG